MAAPKGWVLPQVQMRRKRQWLTQQELAARAGISVSVVRRAERGGPVSSRAVRELAAALGVTPDVLCQDQDAPLAAV